MIAGYSKFIVAFLVTLIQIAAIYQTDGDYKFAITSAITAVAVLLVPNLPQFPWLKGLVAMVGAGTAFYFSVDNPGTTEIMLAVVAAFGAIGVYGVNNEGTDAAGVRPQHALAA